MAKIIDVNVVPEIVAKHTQLISKVASTCGTQIFKVEVRMAWQGGQEGFEKDKRAIETGEAKGFILNRSPKRLIAKNILIAGVCLTKDVDGEYVIAINPKEDGTADMLLPINDNTLDMMGKTTQDAIAEAIHGEKDHFFLNGKVLVQILNAQMKKEIAALEQLRDNINKMINTLKGDIDSNDKKAEKAENDWVNSALSGKVMIPTGTSGASVSMTVHNDPND